MTLDEHDTHKADPGLEWRTAYLELVGDTLQQHLGLDDWENNPSVCDRLHVHRNSAIEYLARNSLTCSVSLRTVTLYRAVEISYTLDNESFGACCGKPN